MTKIKIGLKNQKNIEIEINKPFNKVGIDDIKSFLKKKDKIIGWALIKEE